MRKRSVAVDAGERRLELRVVSRILPRELRPPCCLVAVQFDVVGGPFESEEVLAAGVEERFQISLPLSALVRLDLGLTAVGDQFAGLV